MAFSNGVTEVADSEDEPMTSSPVRVTAEAVAPAHQETSKGTVCTHQALAAHAANEASEQAEALHVNRDNASVDIGASKSHAADLMPETTATSTLQQEGATVKASCHIQEGRTPEYSPQPPSESRNILAEHSVFTDASQLDKRASALAGSSLDPSTPHPDTDQMVNEETTSAAVAGPANELHGPVITDATEHPQKQPSTSESFSNQANSAPIQKEQRVMENKLFERPGIGEVKTIREQNGSDNVVSQEATNTAPESQPHDTTTCRLQDLIVNETSPAVQVGSSNQVMLQTNGDRVSDERAANATQSTSTTVPESAEIRSVESGTERHSADAEGSGVAQTPVADGNHQLESEVDEAMHMSDATYSFETGILGQIQSTRTDEQKWPQGASPSITMNLENSVLPQTPQEITLAELKAQKAALLASLRALPAIQVLIEETASADAGTSEGDDDLTAADIMTAANKIVKEHIKLLHEYNELKDVGQGLMGLIADQRGARIVEVQEEFGIDAQD